jgi:hypothetical protein
MRWLIVFLQVLGLTLLGFLFFHISKAYPEYLPEWALVSRTFFVVCLSVLLFMERKLSKYDACLGLLFGFGAVALGLFNGTVLDKFTVRSLLDLSASGRETILIAFGYSAIAFVVIRSLWTIATKK